MALKVVHPQEIVVWSILPFLRRELSIEMKSLGFEQKKIASLLKITEAAVSQYLNDKRASNNIKMSRELKDEISLSAKNIIKDNSVVLSEMQRLVNDKEIRSLICSIHKKEFNAPQDCHACEIGAK